MRKHLIHSFVAVLFLCTLLSSSLASEATQRTVVDVCGVPVSSEDTELDLNHVSVTNIDELCDALDGLPNVKSVYMWKTKLSRDQRDQLVQRFPDKFFGWEIRMNSVHCIRTDATAFSTLGKKPHIFLNQLWNFTYCPNLLALDLGHNVLKDVSFLQHCNKLKVLILADTGLTDISPIAYQTDLEYLELFLNKITDISPLANLVNLRDVNLAFNNITDLSPLYDLPKLERVWLMMNKNLTQEEVDRLREHQPDCEIVTRSWGATGNIWPKDGNQIPGTSWRDHPHYDTIYYIFNGGGYVDWDVEIPIRK